MKEKKAKSLWEERKEAYATIPRWLICNDKLSHAEFRLLALLVQVLGGRNRPYRLTFEQLGARASLSTGSVAKALKRFVVAGWVVESQHMWPRYLIDLDRIATDLYLTEEQIDDSQPRVSQVPRPKGSSRWRSEWADQFDHSIPVLGEDPQDPRFPGLSAADKIYTMEELAEMQSTQLGMVLAIRRLDVPKKMDDRIAAILASQ